MYLKLSALAAATLILTGCASVAPMNLPESAAATEAKALEKASQSDSWDSPAIEEQGKPSVILFSPQSIPEVYRTRPIEVEFNTPDTTIQDVVNALAHQGYSVILADTDAGQKSFYMPRFKGTLGAFVANISRATDVWFTWHEGAIIVGSKESVALTIPQEEKFAEQLSKGMESLGFKDAGVSWHAGMASLELSPSQFRKTAKFLERMTANAAVVSLQVAVVNVTLNQSVKQGIDWDKLQVSALRGGTFRQFSNAQNDFNSAANSGNATNTTGVINNTTTNTGTTTGNTTTGSTTDTTVDKTIPSKIGALRWAGSALQGAIYTKSFDFTGMFNYLQTYGNAETKQNVVLKTTTGNKVEFKSLTQIPYVEEVGVTTTGAVGVTGAAAATGSTKTAKADDGLTVEMTPTYDASSNTVSVTFKLSIKAVVAFNDLSAGNQIGKLSQPTTADRTLTENIRLQPGQTAIVGGLMYDSVNNNKGGPAFLPTGSRLESQALTVNRQSMFIVVRPTILKLGQVAQQEGQPLDFIEAGKVPPPVEIEEEIKPASPSKPTRKADAKSLNKAK